MFSQAFLHGLVLLALLWTGLGAVALVALLLRDHKNGKLW